MQDVHYKETQWGFEYGSVDVSRIASDPKKGWVVVGLNTLKHKNVQFYATKTGKIRFWVDGVEWKAPPGGE